MADLIQLRRDTEANWTSVNPYLAQGEIAITLDDLATDPKFKVGDGLTRWVDLPYVQGGTDIIGVVRQIPYCDVDGSLKFNENLEFNEADNKITVKQATGVGYCRVTVGDNSNYIKLRSHDTDQTYIKMYGTDSGISLYRSTDTASYPFLECVQNVGGEVFSVSNLGSVYTKGLRVDIASKGVGKVLTSDVDGNASWATISGLLPSGTENQILRHNGTSWAVAQYTTLTDGVASATFELVNGTSPLLKKATLGVSDVNSWLTLSTDPSAPAGGQTIEMTTSTTLQQMYLKYSGSYLISLLRDESSGSININNASSEQVVLQAYKTGSDSNANISVLYNGNLRFRVFNSGKIYTKQAPQINSADAAVGKVLTCTHVDGSSEWQNISLPRKGLEIQSANQEVPTTTPIAVTGFQFTAKANKKYLVKYRIYILNTQDEWSPNIQVKIGDGTGAETAFGSLLARRDDSPAYSIYKELNIPPQSYNTLFDWSLGQDVYFHGDNYMHLDLEVIVEMGNAEKTVDLYITLPSAPTVPPSFTVRADSYCRWEEF